MFTPEINKKVTEAFQKIIEMKGREIFRRCRGISPYMTDLLPGFEYEAIRGIIKIACDYNIFAILLDESIPNTDARIEYAAEQMTQKTLYQKELTREVVSWAFKALYPSKAINPESILTVDDEAIIDMTLGYCYQKGIGVPQNYGEAFKCYKKSAEKNNSEGQLYLGYCYEKGIGTPQNYGEAFKWYKRSAEQNNSDGQNSLGLCYLNGWGTPQNDEEAFKWFKKSAEKNYSSGQYNIGYCYEKGIGTPQNYGEAFKWYKKAADQNLAVAQNQAGLCYFYGWGVSKSIEEACKMFRKAAAQGDPTAKKNLESLMKK